MQIFKNIFPSQICETYYKSYLDKFQNIAEDDPEFCVIQKEIHQVAQFLCLYNPKIEIIEKPKYPDFIIKYGKRLIGLEHERLVNESIKSLEGSIENLIKSVEIEFRRKFPNEKKLVTIYVKDNIQFKKAE